MKDIVIFLLSTISLIVLCGTISPIIIKLFFCREVSIGSTFFNATIIPLFSCLIVMLIYFYFSSIFFEHKDCIGSWNRQKKMFVPISRAYLPMTALVRFWSLPVFCILTWIILNFYYTSLDRSCNSWWGLRLILDIGEIKQFANDALAALVAFYLLAIILFCTALVIKKKISHPHFAEKMRWAELNFSYFLRRHIFKALETVAAPRIAFLCRTICAEAPSSAAFGPHASVLFFTTVVLLESSNNYNSGKKLLFLGSTNRIGGDWILSFRSVDSYYGPTFWGAFGPSANVLKTPQALKKTSDFFHGGAKIISPAKGSHPPIEGQSSANSGSAKGCESLITYPEIRNYFIGTPGGTEKFNRIFMRPVKVYKALEIADRGPKASNPRFLNSKPQTILKNPKFFCNENDYQGNEGLDGTTIKKNLAEGPSLVQKICPSVATNFCSNIYVTLGSGSFVSGWYINFMVHPFIFSIWIGFLLGTIAITRAYSKSLFSVHRCSLI